MTRQNDNRPRNVALTGEKALKHNHAETFPEEGTDEAMLRPKTVAERPLTEAETVSATRKALRACSVQNGQRR